MAGRHVTWLVGAVFLIAMTGGVAQAGGRPDLRITNMMAPPKVIGVGASVHVIVQLENSGAAAAPRSKGTLLLSSDTSPDKSDRVLKVFSVRALESRRWLSLAVAYTVPAAYGSWHVIACLDAKHAVRESNEKNNCRTKTSKMLIDHKPDMPVVTGATPASPSPDTPIIHGTGGPVGATVFVYTNATCSGTKVSNSKAIGASGTWTAPVPLKFDGTYVIHAKTHWWSGESECSATSVSFTRDTALPPIPTDLAITGGGTSSDTTPTITGTTEPGATVKVFSGYESSDGTCKTPLGSTVAGIDGHFAWTEPIPLSAPDDTYRTYYLMAQDAAGNPSNCTYPKLDYLLS